jgi:hypothetical protein
MKKCEACGVRVHGQERCPLCQGALTGEASEQEPGRMYPSYFKQRRRLFIWRLIAMLIVLSCAVSVLINLRYPSELTRFVVGCIVGGGACALLEIALVLHMRGSAARIIHDHALIACALCLIWDVATGFHGWSIDYVIPLVLLGALLGIQTVRLAARQSFSDYGVRVLALSALCVAFPLLTGAEWPGLACMLGGVASIVELLFLEGRKLSAELARRLHL